MNGTTLMEEELRIIEDKMPPTNAVSRRIAIRSIFSSIEILLSEISAKLVSMVRPPADVAPHEEKHRYFLELCALSEISYEIRQNGKLVIKPPRNSVQKSGFVCARIDRQDRRRSDQAERNRWMERISCCN